MTQGWTQRKQKEPKHSRKLGRAIIWQLQAIAIRFSQMSKLGDCSGKRFKLYIICRNLISLFILLAGPRKCCYRNPSSQQTCLLFTGFIFLKFHVYACLPMCMYVQCACTVSTRQKGASDPQDLELQKLIRVLGSESPSSTRAVNVPKLGAISSVPY